ncbi:MAG: OadG family transporter subunit [Verrucomicrobiota bacterium]
MDASITTTLAMLARHPSFGESIQFILVGFLFVFLVLLILAAVTQVIGLAFRDQATPAPAKTPKPEPVVAAVAEDALPHPPRTTEELDEEELKRIAVVVAAAVHSVIGDKPHRIVSITPTSNTWAQEGRRAIFSSHSVR